MPSIAAFIQSLLSEDMYATGMIEKMDERCDGHTMILIIYAASMVRYGCDSTPVRVNGQ